MRYKWATKLEDFEGKKEPTRHSQDWDNLSIACQNFFKAMARQIIALKAEHLLIMGSNYNDK